MHSYFLRVCALEFPNQRYTKGIISLLLHVRALFFSIRGFHVTQVSLIITQVKNKITYHLINRVKKFKNRRGVINKQLAKVSGMCNIPNSSYSAKGITENYSV